MTAPSRYAPLFEPIDIGPKRMRNRFMQVPQCNGGGTVRPPLSARQPQRPHLARLRIDHARDHRPSVHIKPDPATFVHNRRLP